MMCNRHSSSRMKRGNLYSYFIKKLEKYIFKVLQNKKYKMAPFAVMAEPRFAAVSLNKWEGGLGLV